MVEALARRGRLPRAPCAPTSAAHAGGNATAEDFLAALAAASGSDTTAVLRSFLDQAGAPALRAEPLCGDAPRVVLGQEAYRPLGAASAQAKTWTVPACVHLANGAPRTCGVLSGRSGQLPLAGAACPDWAFANAGGTGYYRVALPPGLALRALRQGGLSVAERVTLAGDTGALAASGGVTAAEALEIAARLAGDPDRHVTEAALALLRRLEAMVPDERLPELAAFVRRSAGPRAAQLGWTARAGDGEDERLLRRALLPAVAQLGRDEPLGRQAVRLADEWLDGRSTPDPDVIDPLLVTAAGAGGRELFDRLRAEALRAGDRGRRERLLGALGGVSEPDLVREALALTLDERLDARESVTVLAALGARRASRRAAWDFLRERYDTLAARLPGGPYSPAAALPWIGAGLCTPGAGREIEAFFGPRLRSAEGSPRGLRLAVESADQCAAQRAAQAGSASAFLRDALRPAP